MLYFVTPFIKGQPIILKYNKGLLITKTKLDVPLKIRKLELTLVFGTAYKNRFYAEELFHRGFSHRAQFVKTWCASNGFFTVKHFAWQGLIRAERITKKILRNKLEEAKRLHDQPVEGLILRHDQPTKNAYIFWNANTPIEKICNRYAAASCGRIRSRS